MSEEKYGSINEIKEELNKVLELIDIKNKQNSDMINIMDLYDNISILKVLFAVIDNSRCPNNPYEIIKLEEFYYTFFKEENKLFTIEELFNEGWLIKCMDEWHQNAVRYKLKNASYFKNDKEKQIFSFLKYLAGFPYEDSFRLEIVNIDKLLLEISQIDSSINLEWLCNESVLNVCDEKYYIDDGSQLWNKYGNLILAYRWKTIDEKELIKKFHIWFSYWRKMRNCSRPYDYIDNVEELYIACLDKLETENAFSNWILEEKIYRKKIYIEYENLRKKEDIQFDSLPKNPAERIDFFKRRINSMFRIERPYYLAEGLYHFCSRKYSNVPGKLKIRFLACLKIPYINIKYFQNANNKEILIDCLEDADLFMEGVVNIWNLLNDAYKMNKYVKEIWRVCDNKILDLLTLKIIYHSDRDFIKVVIQLLEYLNKESRYYSKEKTSECEYYMAQTYERVLDWYEKKIITNKTVNNLIIEYFFNEFKNSKNTKSMNDFEILVTLLKFQKDDKYYLKMFETFVSLIKRSENEDFLISTVNWSLFKNKVWIEILRKICNNEANFNNLLVTLTINDYKYIVSKNEKQSPILSIGKISEIYLYFLASAIEDLHEDLSKNQKKDIETIFIEKLFGFQIESSDLFSSESIRLLDSYCIISKCMSCVSFMSKNSKSKFIKMAKNIDFGSLIFWVDYIKDNSVRNELIKIIVQRNEEDLTKYICFIPTYQELINKMISLSFRFDNRELVTSIRSTFDELKNMLMAKEEKIYREYNGWIESIECQILLLEGNEQEIIKGNNSFYKGYIYLNSDKTEDIEKAVQIFEKYLEDKNSVSGILNYFVACVLMVINNVDSESEYNKYLLKAKEVSKLLHTQCNLSQNEMKILYVNELYLYEEIKENSSFWGVYSNLPDELKTDYECVQYIIKMYYLIGDTEKAELLLDEIAEIYGQTDEINKLRKNEKEYIVNKPELKAINEQEEDIVIKIKNAIEKLKNISESDLALIRLDKKCDRPEEVNMASMIISAIRKLDSYSYNLLRNNCTAHENTYNRTLKILFNDAYTELFGYKMEDQVQEGTTGTTEENGENGSGSIDLMVTRNNENLCIIEGIKLNSLRKKYVLDHIMKIYPYNASEVDTGFIVIYSTSKNPAGLWKKYIKYLEEISGQGHIENCGIKSIEIGKELEIVNKGLIKVNNMFICMTKQYFEKSGISTNLYHILIDVAKKNEIEVGKKSRNLVKNNNHKK